MPIAKGVKVHAISGGPEMMVRAVGDSIAICEWEAGGVLRQEIFSISELTPAAVTQQAQQPQPTPRP